MLHILSCMKINVLVSIFYVERTNHLYDMKLLCHHIWMCIKHTQKQTKNGQQMFWSAPPTPHT